MAAIVGTATNGRPRRRARAFAVSSSAAADANHHAAIVTGLSRQLLYIAFAAMAAKQNMLCPWQFKRWRKFCLRRSNGAFAVDPHRARKLFISEKIVQVIETAGM
ncbi:hypothetical protein ECZU29_54400 [Escherichia coli]|nr:hypothetical protein ECZU29_54400 [Escherichia coli]